MDDIVRQALAKWPHVPHCYDWLGLDERGDWYMRDDRVQAQGPFPHVKGSRLLHDKLIAFIGRNYEADADGCWFFQNGPQRVYVELQSTPWIWRLQPDGSVCTHTGLHSEILASFVDEAGRLYLHGDCGIGLVHSLDMAQAATCIEEGRWTPTELRAETLPQRFGFVRSPQVHHQGTGNRP